MAIIDVISYNGEADMLEIRLNILGQSVDQFIICEASTTFSGMPKPLHYEEQKERFKQFWPKIKYFVINEHYTPEEILEATNSPNTDGAWHWKTEFLQKESIKKALVHLKDDDICFIGDVDEIWKPELSKWQWFLPVKIRYLVYTYYLNNLSTELFWGTLVGTYTYIKNECLNHLRSDRRLYWDKEYLGWHFTSMGGYDEVKRKLENSYTAETYADELVMTHLEENVKSSRDFLGRGFTYTLDETDWPEYLRINKHKYKHLIK